jgi:hypothetical protein
LGGSWFPCSTLTSPAINLNLAWILEMSNK